MTKLSKESFIKFIKEYCVEIGSAIVFVILILVTMIDKRLITNFEILRPFWSGIFSIAFVVITIVILLTYYSQKHQKKLESTKKESAFAKTLECTDKVRKMSKTQTIFVSEIETVNETNTLPKDIESNDSHIIELYFAYEKNLNI